MQNSYNNNTKFKVIMTVRFRKVLEFFVRINENIETTRFYRDISLEIRQNMIELSKKF